MIIKPKIRGFICTTAHPKGCFHEVERQVNYVKSHPIIPGPKNVLIIGASTGYGLASRIVSTFSSGANTIGVFFEKPADEKRTASPGWYNTAAFEQLALAHGYQAKSINGDAFSDEIKAQTANCIRENFGKIDLIIYSLASPKRRHPETGEIFSSVLKPIGQAFSGKTIDPFRNEVKNVVIEPATQDEVNATIEVMGGDDWKRWIHYLMKENLLADNVKTIAYSYIGPELTHAIYKNGTIGQAKKHLKETADELNHLLSTLHGEAIISVDKAVVTQASAAIPVVPLYIALLFKFMKEKGTHEGCIEQMYRLFSQHLYSKTSIARDEDGYIRLDDLEMMPEIQNAVSQAWPLITSDNLTAMTDVEGYKNEFYHLFGFNIPGINEDLDVDNIQSIPSID